ncbi:MAG: DUF4838 domain-containing protein [Candidatus Omnitrophica bacterium]|nr:DUF4838 domain-containing protein [Candidatus Omnitrophota bacterium]
MKKILIYFFISFIGYSQEIGVWGWRTTIWERFFQKEYNIKVEKLQLDENGRMPIKEFKKYKLVILCQGSLKEKINDEEIEEVKNYLSSGGKIIVFSGTVSGLFSRQTSYDLDKSQEIVGAKKYLYAKFKGEPIDKNSPLFKNVEFDDYPWLYDQPSLADITTGKVIIGNKVGGSIAAKVLINKVGNGFFVYISPVSIAYYKDDWDKNPESLNMINFLKNVINMCIKNQPDINEVIKFSYTKKENPFLIKNASPKVVVLSEGNEKNNARAFVNMINTITGSELSVEERCDEKDVLRVYIGRHKDIEKFNIDFEKIHPFGYYIKLLDNNLIISGKSPTGTSYAIWDFLKRFAGYRDFGPTEIYKIIPKLENIKLPENLNIKEEPSFITWTNAGFYGGNGGFYRSWRTTLLATHSLFLIYPPSKYAKDHPEYYPMIKGERFIPKENMHGTWQPCVSNPDLVPIAIEFAKDYFNKNPEMLGLPAGVNDGGGDCQCPECLKLKEKYGNQYIPFYNSIGRELKKIFPDKLVSFIAYGRICSIAPKNINLEPNLYVEITSGLRNNLEEIKKWKSAGAQNIGIYDYLYGGGYVVPRYYPHIIGNAWKKAYKEFGLKGGWIESFIQVWLYDGPKQYILNELAWDINKNIDDLINDYFSNFYKESSKPMKEFFDKIEEIYSRKKDPLHPMADWQRVYQFDEYRWTDIDYLDKKLENAKEIAKSEEVKKRIELFSKIWNLSKLYVESYLTYKDLINVKEVKDEKSLESLIKKSIEGLNKCKEIENYKMTEFEEKNIFVNTNLEKFINQHTLKVKPFLDNEIARTLNIAVYFLEKKYGWQKTKEILLNYVKNFDENIKPFLLSQIYMKECDESKKNLILSSSFEPEGEEEIIPEEQLKKYEWKQFSKKLKGWTTWHFQQSVTEFVWDKEEAHSGKYSLSIRENQISGCFQTFVKVEPGCMYKLSFWVKQKPPDKGGNLIIRWMDKDGWADQGEKKAPRIIVPYPKSSESKWQKVEIIFFAPLNVTSCVPLFSAPKQEPDEGIWFDDVEMYKIYDPKFFN